jgi:hypothetical protein
VKRATRNQDEEGTKIVPELPDTDSNEEEDDLEWQSEINQEIVISKKSEEEIKEDKKRKRERKRNEREAHDGRAKTEPDVEDLDPDVEEDLNYWPDNWEELV